jgi:hypothetical protein
MTGIITLNNRWNFVDLALNKRHMSEELADYIESFSGNLVYHLISQETYFFVLA